MNTQRMREVGLGPRPERILGTYHLTPSTSSAGLTFIEALVSLAIIGVLTGILLAGAGGVRREATVRAAANEVGGFLREAAALTLNGTKACNPDDPLCSEYRVRFGDPDANAYNREAIGAGDTPIVRTLPGNAAFLSSGELSFRYTPPTLSVYQGRLGPTERVLSGAEFVDLAVGGIAGARTWHVCVRATGTVEVTGGTC